MMRRLKDGSALPRGLSFGTRLYLRPDISGRRDAFDLIIRKDARNVTQVRLCQTQIEDWVSGEAPEHGARIARQLAAIRNIAVQDIALPGLSSPVLMGVVNVTPDSFSDGGAFLSPDAAIEQARHLVDEGAAILDIGGESTRPGAAPISIDEELRRVLPVIEGCAGLGVPISIDSRNAAVMDAAIKAGARMINDVTALSHDADSLKLAADSGLPVCLMHSPADPKVMQDNPQYDRVVFDIYDALERRIAVCRRAGIARARLIVDPGIGFGKTVEHNLALIKGLSMFHSLGCPVMLGASRKSFIGKLDRPELPPAQRVAGSLAAAMAGLRQGVQIFRVHDVAATRQALCVAGAIEAAEDID